MGALTHNGEVLQRLPADASQINYDNTSSGLAATQVQDAIDELKNTLTDTYKIVTSGLQYLGDLSANASGYVTFIFTVPAGYVTTRIWSVIKRHPADTTSLQISLSYAAGVTGNTTVYLSYYTIAAVANASTDYTFDILCKKVS